MVASFIQFKCTKHFCDDTLVFEDAQCFNYSSGFVANLGCFDIGFVLPFALSNMNPIQNYHRGIMNPEHSNQPEKFVGTLYPRKFEFGNTSRVNSFRIEFE